MDDSNPRPPVVCNPHGDGPWPFVVRAILVVSAHRAEAVSTVMSHPQPPLRDDDSGFPTAAYAVSDAFDRWMTQSGGLPQTERNAAVAPWADVPSAREALLPLMVVMGASISAVHFDAPAAA